MPVYAHLVTDRQSSCRHLFLKNTTFPTHILPFSGYIYTNYFLIITFTVSSSILDRRIFWPIRIIKSTLRETYSRKMKNITLIASKCVNTRLTLTPADIYTDTGSLISRTFAQGLSGQLFRTSTNETQRMEHV